MDYSHIDSTRNLNSTLFKNKFRRTLCNILLNLENRLNEAKSNGTADVHSIPGRIKFSEDEKKNRELVDSGRAKVLKSFKVQEIESWLENKLENKLVLKEKSQEPCPSESLIMYSCIT